MYLPKPVSPVACGHFTTLTVALLLSFFCTFSFGQSIPTSDSVRVLSKFEKFYTQKGSMVKIESNKLGSVSDIEISLQRVSSMENGKYVMALVLTQTRTALFSYVGFGSLYIDFDEIEAVQKALNFYLQEVKTKKPKNDPRYLFTTTNNVMVSCSYVPGAFGSGWYVSLSQKYEYTQSTAANSTITVKNKDIDDMVEAINKAKQSTSF